MPLKGSHMGSETTGRKTPQRARLSDITNTAPLSFSKHRVDDHAIKGCDCELQKELANLRKALAQKEELIEAQKVNMEKLWSNFNKKTKQNEDIIRHNGYLYKELMQARDRLKILQHENAQMASAQKAMKSELQAPFDKQPTMPNLLAKLAESRARRTVSSCEALTESLDFVKDERSELSATCRSTLRRRASLSYKEPSLKTKLRQPDSTPSQVKPFHRRESRIQQLHKVCEEGQNVIPATMPSSADEEVAETLLPPCPQTVPQSESCSLSGDVLEDQNPSSSIIPDGHISSSEQLPRCAHDSSSSLGELPSGRPSRRSSLGTFTSYKEASLNTKLRRSS